ncbi:MAG: ATP-binding protein [Myxacorys californica WJT36-NPBG1]|jgi:hypothetical protein|nr:ATP-binding protein [Myxacorys californica WJT36-NPBG1]
MSNLSKYGRSAIDKTFPDKEETVFGHMVLELGMSPVEASQALRPWVKDYSHATDRAKTWGYGLGVLGIAGGVVLAATVGIGIPAIAPLAVGIYNVVSARGSAEEHSTREAEFLILKECPELLKLLYALGKRGMPKEVIVECYDSLVFSFMGQFSLHSQNGQLSGFDVSKQDIVQLFEELIREKMSMETGAKEILTDFESMNFDTLYQSEPSQVQRQLPVGENTRLNAVEVQPARPSARTVHSVPQSEVIDIAESLAVNLQSTLIVGQPGSGKGVTIAMATRAVKRLHPDIEIWAIDPKADPSEAWYWQAVDHYLPVKIEPFTSDASMKKIKEAIDEFISKFQFSNSPKLLIFDEALAVKEKTGSWFTGLMSGFNALCSMGRSRRQYGWLVSQSPNTGDFGISGGVRNVYRRILLLSADNLGLLDNGSTFFSGKPSPEVLQLTKRAFFDSTINGWGAVPFYSVPTALIAPVPHPQPEPKPSGESRRERLEALMNEDAASPVEKFYHSGADDSERSLGSETDSDEFAIRSEVKRFLLANPDGSKPRDLANKARSPVRKMLVDDIKLVLDLMTLEGEIYEVDGVFFCNSN